MKPHWSNFLWFFYMCLKSFHIRKNRRWERSWFHNVTKVNWSGLTLVCFVSYLMNWMIFTQKLTSFFVNLTHYSSMNCSFLSRKRVPYVEYWTVSLAPIIICLMTFFYFNKCWNKTKYKTNAKTNKNESISLNNKSSSNCIKIKKP